MILKKVVTGFLAVCFLGMHCMTLPTQSVSQSYQIKLSLEVSGRYSAEFSGEPIKTIIETKDSVLFNSIAWHSGKGIFTVPDSMIGKKDRRFIAFLSWKTYPLKRDSISKKYFDSVYVSIGGGLQQSNVVMVNVTNLPVVFDSLKIKNTVFTGPDTVWKYSTVDSQKTLSFTLYVRDLDGKTTTITGSDRLNALKPINTSQFTFTVPSGEYIDTLNFIISDGSGGQVICMLILSYFTPNTPPEFDSLVINKQSITGTDKILKVAFSSFDTLNMKLYAHDNDVGDSVRVLWSAGIASRLKRDSLNSQNASYICSACKDSVHDSTIIVDTLTIRCFDIKKDTVTKKVVIYKGRINLKPVIVSIKVGDTLLKSTDSLVMISLKGGIEYPLQDSASDPNKDSLTSSWILKETSRIRASKSGTFYTTPSKITKDTLVLSVSDGELTATKKLIVDIKNIVPVFDSLKVNNSSYKVSDSMFSIEVFVGDTLNLAVYARDLDPAVDTLKYIWKAGNPAALFSITKWMAKYKCPLKVTIDTVTFLIVDGLDSIEKTVRVNIGSQAPVIDSLKIDSVKFSGTQSTFSDTAAARDTVEFKAFAHDNDHQDLVSFRWKALNSAQMVAETTPNKVKYVCKDTSYVDTISVTAMDNYGNSSIKAVELTIEKK